MLALMKRGSDPSGQGVSLLHCFSALRTAAEVVFYRLPVVAGEPVKEVIVQGLIRDVPKGKIRSAFLPFDFGFRDNSLPFDASRFSQSMLLSREDDGTRPACNQMI